MKERLIERRHIWLALILAAIGGLLFGLKRAPAQAVPDRWTAAQVMTPEELVQQLAGPAKPSVISVTFKQLYDRAHVPGALYFGPGQNQAALANLRQWAESQPKDKKIVLYCGCCPWRDCPNIHPAFSLLKDLGFTNLHVVRIDTDFTRAWCDKKYPVEAAK